MGGEGGDVEDFLSFPRFFSSSFGIRSGGRVETMGTGVVVFIYRPYIQG